VGHKLKKKNYDNIINSNQKSGAVIIAGKRETTTKKKEGGTYSRKRRTEKRLFGLSMARGARVGGKGGQLEKKRVELFYYRGM